MQITTNVLLETLHSDTFSNNSTLSTPKDMLNDEGDEEIIVTTSGVLKGTNVPDQVYTIEKSKLFDDMSDSDSHDDVGKK